MAQGTTPEDIRRSDRERLLATLLEPAEIEDEDRELGARLLAERSPEDIAAALVRAYRARMPSPEEMIDGAQSEAPPRQEGPRAGFDDSVWFRMNIGRRHNADPRWLLPLLCRRGHITRGDIGAIRIAPNETAFEITQAVASRFVAAVKRTAAPDGDGEGSVLIEPMTGAPGQPDRGPPRLRSAPPRARHSPKPYKARGPRTR